MSVWTTKDGIRIKIKYMDTRHIGNCMGMLERYARNKKYHLIAAAYSFLSTLNGEMAIDCAEREIEYLENSDWHDFLPEIYYRLSNEIERRKELK